MKDYTDEIVDKGLCPNCRSPNDYKMICPSCGFERGCFYCYDDRDYTEEDKLCPNHPTEKTDYHCAACDKYFCKKCIVSGGRLMVSGFQEYYLCKGCMKLRKHPPKKPKPNLCVFHPIGIDIISTEKCADCERNMCDDCISQSSRCKKCKKPLCHNKCGTFRSDGLCYECYKSLKWWEFFKY